MAQELNPKDKAKDLIDKHFFLCTFNSEGIVEPVAIQAALLTVEELIEEHNYKNPISWNVSRKKYWQSVKSELLNHKTFAKSNN